MRRRRFLQMLGAAFAGPALPALPASAAPAVYSKSTFHAAIYYAQSRVSFSVWGMAQQLGIPVAQAEVLMHDMSARGILGPLQGTTFGGRWATSNVMRQEMVAARAGREIGKLRDMAGPETGAPMQVDLSRLIAHLRDLADRHFADRAEAV